MEPTLHRGSLVFDKVTGQDWPSATSSYAAG
jgi:hypothetical protein